MGHVVSITARATPSWYPLNIVKTLQLIWRSGRWKSTGVRSSNELQWLDLGHQWSSSQQREHIHIGPLSSNSEYCDRTISPHSRGKGSHGSLIMYVKRLVWQGRCDSSDGHFRLFHSILAQSLRQAIDLSAMRAAGARATKPGPCNCLVIWHRHLQAPRHRDKGVCVTWCRYVVLCKWLPVSMCFQHSLTTWYSLSTKARAQLYNFPRNIFNSSPPGQNDGHFEVFKCMFLNDNVNISIQIYLNLVPRSSINNKPALVQVIAWRRSGNKPLPEPMTTQFTDAYMRH